MINVSCVRALDQWAFWGKIWKNHWSLFSGTPPITATSTNPGLWLPPTFKEARKLSLFTPLKTRSSSSRALGVERALTWKATAPQQWPRFAVCVKTAPLIPQFVLAGVPYSCYTLSLLNIYINTYIYIIYVPIIIIQLSLIFSNEQ